MEPDPSRPGPLDPLLQECFVRPLLQQLQQWSKEARDGRRRRPLIALNGPVGAGKSTLGRRLERLASDFGLRLMVASIDDLYLGWPERAERLAGNPFGVSRVPPGSHDLPLLEQALIRWRETGRLRLPRFDKTLAAGQGDRAGWREGVCDALVLEGWLMGCRPLGDARMARLMEAVLAPGGPSGEAGTAGERPFRGAAAAPSLRPGDWRWLPRWNHELEAYRPIWEACDGLWLLRPLHWGLPRRWRFQAEARQRRGGGGWLPPEELDRLVRASLCSLPPALYQDPLTESLASLDGARRWFRGDGCAPGVADALVSEALAESGQGWTTAERSPAWACSAAHEPDGWSSAQESHAVGPMTVEGQRDGSREPCPTDGTPTSQHMAAAQRSVGARAMTGNRSHEPRPCQEPPIQAVAWLDGRRRCREVWLQASLSPSSSATG